MRRLPTASAGAWARREGFWLLDRLRGRPVRHHYEYVAGRMAGRRPRVDPLASLLDHATTTTPFYEPLAGQGLDRFPIIDKALIKREGNRFRSRAHRSGAVHVKRTSGSTGTPLVVAQDPGKRRRTIAETIYFNERAGLELGDRLIWLFATPIIPVPWWRRAMQNITVVDHLGMDEERIGRLVEALRREEVGAILALSSLLVLIADHVVDGGIDPDDIRLGTAISSGEILLPGDREHIAAALGCRVVDRYANEENGVLACGEPHRDDLVLNIASFHFEFLRLEDDEPQVPGALGRVVITDLFNRATPMIRYDTGDLAVVGEVDGKGTPLTLTSIAGREVDAVFDTSGGRIPSSAISAGMVRAFPEIDEYRLVQEDARRYRLMVALGRARHREPEFSQTLRRWLGVDAEIEVELVARVPRLPSGKRRPVIANYRPPAEARGRLRSGQAADVATVGEEGDR